MTSWHCLEDIDVLLCHNSLSHSIDKACFSTLVEAAPDVRSKALALSTSLPHAGDWLKIVPSPAPGLCVLDQEFRLCLDYWLGVRMTVGPRRCPACGKTSAVHPMGAIRWDRVTVFTIMMLSVMLCLPQVSLPH